MTDWRDRAACRDADPELFRSHHQQALSPYQADLRKHPVVGEALRYCDACPVKTQCLAVALNETTFASVGIWGGMHISWTQANKNLAEARRRVGMDPNERPIRKAVYA